MPRIFVTDNAITGSTVNITGSDAFHISRSLRMKQGEIITVCDMKRTEYQCALTSFSPDSVTAEILSEKSCSTEPPYRVKLFMALPKGDKMEYVIQKAVETGVSEIIPFASERSVVKLNAESGEKKQQRWQKIADSASGQCGRGILPSVHAPISFGQAVIEASKGDISFMCWEAENGYTLPQLLKNAGKHDEICFLIGSEGGFTEDEANQATAAGLKTVGLGKRILRCESAPVFVLSCISYQFELC